MEPLAALLIKLKEHHAKYPNTPTVDYFELIRMIEEVFADEEKFQKRRDEATINEMH